MKLLLIASAALLALAGATSAIADTGKTRNQVQSELTEAIRTGDILGSGESSLKLNELFPQRYAAVAVVAGKSRSDVQAELAQAVGNGDMLVAGDGFQRQNEVRPDLYPLVPKALGKSRVQVQNELADAIGSGDMIVGETSLTAYELFPGQYHGVRHAAAKARSTTIATTGN